MAEGAGRSLEGLRGLTRKARISRRYSATSPYQRPMTAADRNPAIDLERWLDRQRVATNGSDR